MINKLNQLITPHLSGMLLEPLPELTFLIRSELKCHAVLSSITFFHRSHFTRLTLALMMCYRGCRGTHSEVDPNEGLCTVLAFKSL